jgi:CRP/FNR family cyclic AMP-dependent transcriptional regulator
MRLRLVERCEPRVVAHDHKTARADLSCPRLLVPDTCCATCVTLGAVGEWQIFGGLPENEVRRLVAVARRRRFERREVVFHEGDPADSLHLVSRGRFAARLTTKLGDSTTVALHGPGDAFGELALVEPGSLRSTTIAALEPGETYAVHRRDFARLRTEYPRVNELLVSLLAERLRRSSELLAEALFVPAETRVLRRLVELVNTYPDRIIPLKQEEIAGLAGTSRATVNRVLRAQAGRGTVELRRGRTVVLDAEELARRASAPL